MIIKALKRKKQQIKDRLQDDLFNDMEDLIDRIQYQNMLMRRVCLELKNHMDWRDEEISDTRELYELLRTVINSGTLD